MSVACNANARVEGEGPDSPVDDVRADRKQGGDAFKSDVRLTETGTAYTSCLEGENVIAG